MLTMIGGGSLNESIRRILRKLITDDYAKNFSYTGHKHKKNAFNQTILASLLTSKLNILNIKNTINCKQVLYLLMGSNEGV